MDIRQAIFKRRGVLLLEVVVAVAILGSLASMAVAKGEAEAQKQELHSVQSAVVAMMFDNRLSFIPNPVTQPTSDMGGFPDATTPPEAKGLGDGDKPGYLLSGHDMTPDGQASPIVDYLSTS